MQSIKHSLKCKQVLLNTARHSIQYGLVYQQAPQLELAQYSKEACANGASFVTLKEGNQLRGCIGTLEAFQPLIQDVAENTFKAAFQDPRFPPVSSLEEPLLHISISLLSAPQKMQIESEDDLLTQISPGKDGITLCYKTHRSTYLPSVWDQLPKSDDFINQLKIKAGLPANFWHKDIDFYQYRCEIID